MPTSALALSINRHVFLVGRLAVLGFALQLLTGCSTTHPAPAYANRQEPAESRRETSGLPRINLAAGIDEAAARALAQRYFECLYGNCGAVAEQGVDEGYRWYFPCQFGYAGEQVPGIAVWKFSRQIGSDEGRHITDFVLLTRPVDPIGTSRFFSPKAPPSSEPPPVKLEL